MCSVLQRSRLFQQDWDEAQIGDAVEVWGTYPAMLLQQSHVHGPRICRRLAYAVYWPRSQDRTLWCVSTCPPCETSTHSCLDRSSSAQQNFDNCWHVRSAENPADLNWFSTWNVGCQAHSQCRSLTKCVNASNQLSSDGVEQFPMKRMIQAVTRLNCDHSQVKPTATIPQRIFSVLVADSRHCSVFI